MNPGNGPKVTVTLIGDAEMAVHCLERLLDSGFDVVGCLPAGAAFAERARSLGVRTFEVDAAVEVLADEPCDWLLSVYNARILPPRVIDHARFGALNFHRGPLPRYAGLYGPTRALLDGASSFGVTWHRLDDGIDTGDIVESEPVSIEPEDTAGTLHERCLDAGRRSFERLLPMLRSDRLVGRPQDRTHRSCFGHSNWSRRGIEIDWRSSVASIRRVVAAHDFGPYENRVGRPRFSFDGRWYALLAAESIDAPPASDPTADPGTTAVGGDGLLRVRAGDGWMAIRGTDPPLAGNLERGRMRMRTTRELDAIEVWDAARFRHEFFWRRRLAAIESVSDREPGGEMITVALGPHLDDLARGLLDLHGEWGEDVIEFAWAWTADELRSDVHPEGDSSVVSLLHPLAPVRIPVPRDAEAGQNLELVKNAITDARRRGPFLRDVLTRPGHQPRPLFDPARMRVLVAEEPIDGSVSAASWVFHRDDGDVWKMTGPRAGSDHPGQPSNLAVPPSR